MSDSSGFQPPPPSAPPPQYQPPPGTHQPPPVPQQYFPPGSPGYMPAPIAPSAGIGMGGIDFAYQFSGRAAWSCGFGVISIALPLLVQGFYFRVTPIFGLIYGVQAISRGQVIGGSVGIGLCLIGGLISLFASGLLH